MADKKRILIIEDDAFLGNALSQKLTEDGFAVSVSRDGREGFEKMKSSLPDLVLLDVLLPGMSGYEILEAKQKDQSIEQIPVVVISNSGQPVEINRALELGVKDYLVKAQFDPEEVVAKVRAQLRGNETEAFDIGVKAEQSSGRPLEGKRVLWVEDDKFLSDIISKKLGSAGCTLVHASDGEEALARLEKEIPDVVLLDIMLSGMDGFEILKRIKSSETTKNVPVIMLSNLGQKDDLEKGKKLGASRFLVKATVNLDEIIKEISEVMKEPVPAGSN